MMKYRTVPHTIFVQGSILVIFLSLTLALHAQTPKGNGNGKANEVDTQGIDPESLELNTTSEPNPDQSGMVDLFNGKDLTGWSVKGGPMPFTVEDGEIVGTCDPEVRLNSFLATDQSYTDFLFTAEYKWSVNSNSGVMFRADTRPLDEKELKKYKDPKLQRVFGYQCEVETSDRGWTGGIYGEAMGGWKYSLSKEKEHVKARAAVKDHQVWNRVTIFAIGNKIMTWINGVPCANLTSSERSSGFIALQVHQGKKGFDHGDLVRRPDCLRYAAGLASRHRS